MSPTNTPVISGIGIVEMRKYDARLREIRVIDPEARRPPRFKRFLLHPSTTIVRFPDLQLMPDQLEALNGKTITFMAALEEIDSAGEHELMCDKLTVDVHG